MRSGVRVLSNEGGRTMSGASGGSAGESLAVQSSREVETPVGESPNDDRRVEVSHTGRQAPLSSGSLLVRGMVPTVLTPFDEDEQIDDVALRAQVRYLLEAGVHGLLVLGSFGECPYLNDEDREILIRTCTETVGGAVPVIVGITAQSTFVAAEQLRQAHRLGATAAMVCLPQYFRLEFKDVRRHYQRLSDMDLLPVLYYHYPAVTNLDLSPAEVAEILSIANVVGIKESTFDMLSVKRHIALARQSNRIYLSGSELNFQQFMDMGGHGVVGPGSLIMPRTSVAMYDAYC